MNDAPTREDLDICRTAQNLIWWTGLWRHNEIHISVERGCVTLRGQIEWDYQRQTAIHALSGVTGVVKIIDELTIKFDQGAAAQSPSEAQTQADVVTHSRWS